MVRTEFSHTAYCVAGTQVSFLHSMLLPFIHCSPFLSLSFFPSFLFNNLSSFLPFFQADKRASNSIGIFKLSNIFGKRRDLVPTKTGDDDNMDSESSDSDDDNNEEKEVEAVLQVLYFLSSHIFLQLTNSFSKATQGVS